MAGKLTPGELRALLSSACTVSDDVAARLPSESPAEGPSDLFAKLVDGQWEAVLRSAPVLIALGQAPGDDGEPPETQVLVAAAAAAVQEAAASEEGARARTLLAAGAAALCMFTQANFTGPLPGGATPGGPEESAADAADRGAAKLLQVDGEELVGRVFLPGHLLLARAILLDPLGLKIGDPEPPAGLALEPPCASWGLWALRALSTHQRVVAKRAATLRAHQALLDPEVARTWGTVPWAASKIEEALGADDPEARGFEWAAPLLAGVCRMELGALADQFGDIEQAAAHLETAGCVMGMDLELTGIMGKRTVHQEDDKAQMVAKVHRSGTLADVSAMERRAAELRRRQQQEDGKAAAGGEDPDPGHISSGWKESEDLNDVLDMPKLEAADSSLGLEDLTSAEQALLLRAAIHEKKREAGDETVKLWKMAPFVEAVLRQPQAAPAVSAAAHLLRSRHEGSRNRTKQRAFLRLTDLVEGLIKAPAIEGSRLCMVYATPLPSLPSVRKEYGEMMISIGLVGEAMRVFEELELWNSLITCYTLMDKKAQATELIKKRLEVYPDDASLLCSLGDCTGDEQMYHEAWEKSGKRSARAMRSLADSAHRKKEYGRAAEFWEAALALNPLHSSGWFSLGHCCIQLQDHDRAVRAFTRCCQLEPDNGASWNNIAAVCLSQKKYKEAFSALAESAKYLRQNWHTWDNYVQVALIIGEHSAAVTGLQHMIHIRQGKDVPMEALSQLAGHFESLDENALSDAHLLYSRFGEVLKAMARLGCSDGMFWTSFARFHAIAGHRTAQRECLLKFTRAMAGTPWQKNEEKYEQLADAMMKLADATLSGVGTGECGRRDLSQVRLQMRGIAKQAEECFDDLTSYENLLQKLDQVTREEEKAKNAELENAACHNEDAVCAPPDRSGGSIAGTTGAGIRNARN